MTKIKWQKPQFISLSLVIVAEKQNIDAIPVYCAYLESETETLATLWRLVLDIRMEKNKQNIILDCFYGRRSFKRAN
jgi:hypothetical protein